MSVHKSIGAALIALTAVSLAGPAWAQAAVHSDSPVPSRTPSASGSAGTRSGVGDESALPVPSTAAGSPGTTGTGAAGTGPTNTMAAPGR